MTNFRAGTRPGERTSASIREVGEVELDALFPRRGQWLTEGDVYLVWLKDEGRAMMARLFVEDETHLRLEPLSMFRPQIKAVRDVEVRGRVLKTFHCEYPAYC